MYKIIGSDQKEYGPISADQMRQWITEGRVNAQTQARAEGSAAWQPVSAFPEFAASFAAPPAAPSPFAPGIANPGSRDLALGHVSGPAIGLIVTAILGILYTLFTIVANLAGIGLGTMNNASGRLDPQMAQFLQLRGTFGIFFAIIPLAIGVLILIGGLKLRKLENYGLCIVAIILAIIPCTWSCCILGPIMGIWALVIINKSEVRQFFT